MSITIKIEKSLKLKSGCNFLLLGELKKAGHLIGFFYTQKQAPMFYIYILYSNKSDIYYVGYTDDIERRLEEHNLISGNSYTSKHRPWSLEAVF